LGLLLCCRFLIHDNDCIFSTRLIEAIRRLGLESKPMAERNRRVLDRNRPA
jgi:hypothetical protein